MVIDAPEQIWKELKRLQGVPSPTELTSDQLRQIRQKILNDKLPAFVTTDYHEGWELHVKHTISIMLSNHRERHSGKQLRRFFPVVGKPDVEGRPWTEDTSEMNEYHKRRMAQAQRSSVLEHGSKRVAQGLATWDEIIAESNENINRAVDDASTPQKDETTNAA